MSIIMKYIMSFSLLQINRRWCTTYAIWAICILL